MSINSIHHVKCWTKENALINDQEQKSLKNDFSDVMVVIIFLLRYSYKEKEKFLKKFQILLQRVSKSVSDARFFALDFVVLYCNSNVIIIYFSNTR